MAAHTQKGSVVVDAFQWNGGTIAAATLPVWAKQLALHTPGDGSLHVPSARGTFKANPTDWVVQISTGQLHVLSAASFAVLYA